MCDLKYMFVSQYALTGLSIMSIICSILLFVKGNITTTVTLSGGLVGGPLVLIPLIFRKGSFFNACCGNLCGSYQPVLLEAIGDVGALYNFGVTLYGVCSEHFDGNKLFYSFYMQMAVSIPKIILCTFRIITSACTEDKGVPSSSSAGL